MKKKILPIIGITLGATAIIAGCGAKEEVTPTTTPYTTVETIKPTEITTSTETAPEKTRETISETASDTTSEIVSETVPTTQEQITESMHDTVQDGRKEIINGDDETIHAEVGMYVDLAQAIGDGYEVGNITILSGDSVSVMGKSSIMTEKKGTSVVRCTLMDVETGTKTETDLKVIVE